MKTMIRLVSLLSFFTFSYAGNAQIVLVKSGRSVARIVTGPTKADSCAARLLQDFVQRMTDVTLPILKSVERKGDIVIGKGDTTGLTEDGFRLSTTGGCLYVSSGGDKGSIYGVVTLLEKYMGVACYAGHTYTFPRTRDISLPLVRHGENPAFRYRQSQGYGLSTDPIYRYWLRLEEPNDAFTAGYWVHTFSRLVPAEEFGRSHPEYYSEINGVRRPGSGSQLCLTNPEVLEIVAHRVDSIFKAHPGMRLISVSQNDGNNTNCTCPSCRKTDAEEGGPSGSLIHFINKLAARFPDKEISTLAYQYTMQPPTKIRPRPNVNIMLCNIDCRREVPLTDNASGRAFVKALEGWSAISNNLFVWDYGINFDNYLVPFPNFPVLQKNIQLFKKNHATMLFSQIAGRRGGDFSEMRTYMVSKLMWNPDCNADSLMRSFMAGYYGAAAPYIYDYEKLLEGALLGSRADLWIYDTAVSHSKGMLNAACRKRYNELFDKAEAAVREQPDFLRRVRQARLSLQYSDLEMARIERNLPEDEWNKKLELFKARSADPGADALNERNNTPADYCRLYPSRYFPRRNRNLAGGASVRWIIPPAADYRAAADTALTDEYLAGDSSKEPGWIGWQGDDGVFVMDMHKVKDVSSVRCDFLYQIGQWSLLPRQVNYAYSTDGKTFKEFGSCTIPDEKKRETLYYQALHSVLTPVKARYIKVEIKNQGVCPGWHFGAGHPAWFFLDEVTVN